MTTYFTATDDDDQLLIQSAVRGSDELATVATRAEADVIDRFTAWKTDFERWPTDECYDLGDGRFVCLRGYNPDASLATATLRSALKYAIAEVISWRLWQEQENPLMGQAAAGAGKGSALRPDANRRYPPDFGATLRNFDVRPVRYYI